MGLGGAYTAIASDASGVIYNPAGLAFAKTDQISASTNSFKKSRILSKAAYGDKDIVVESSGQNSFFGGTHRFHSYSEDLVGGFAIYTPNNESYDQELDLGAAPELRLLRVYSRQKSQHSTLHVTGGLAKLISNDLSVGVSVGYVHYSESVQGYVEGKLGPLTTSEPLPKPLYNNVAQNNTHNFEADGIEFGFGTRYSIASGIDVGVFISSQIMVRQSYVGTQRLNTMVTHEDGSPVTADEVGSESMGAAAYTSQNSEAHSANIFGKPSINARLGFTWTPASVTLVCLDVAYHGAHSGDSSGMLSVWKPVVNVFSGLEQGLTDKLVGRFGVFSNRAASPDPRSDEYGLSSSRIDYYGATAFVGVKRDDSEYSFGTIYQHGIGKTSVARTLETQPIQNATSNSVTIALALTSGL